MQIGLFTCTVDCDYTRQIVSHRLGNDESHQRQNAIKKGRQVGGGGSDRGRRAIATINSVSLHHLSRRTVFGRTLWSVRVSPTCYLIASDPFSPRPGSNIFHYCTVTTKSYHTAAINKRAQRTFDLLRSTWSPTGRKQVWLQ